MPLRKLATKFAIALACVSCIVIVLSAAALGFRFYRQHLAAQALTISGANGIDEGRFVTIGGIEQWIQIRGDDRNNPVLLFVHGGPGGTTIPISSGWRSWEKHFTVVQWDQRGSGRTFGATGSAVASTMTLERMTRDGVELAEHLRRYLHKNKIILVGHSWGSFLGVNIVKLSPEHFSAYVGTGQVVGRATFEKAFEMTVARLQTIARASNNKSALAELEPIVLQPGLNPDNRRVAEKWAKVLALPSDEIFELAGPIPPQFMPGFTLLDWYNWYSGMAFSAKYLRGRDSPMVQRDLPSLGFAFPIPVFFIEGDQDYVTPSEPALDYFKKIVAPSKAFVSVHGGGHFIPLDRPDAFLAELLARVRPIAIDAERPNSR